LSCCTTSALSRTAIERRSAPASTAFWIRLIHKQFGVAARQIEQAEQRLRHAVVALKGSLVFKTNQIHNR
jgi:hypothetical protein